MRKLLDSSGASENLKKYSETFGDFHLRNIRKPRESLRLSPKASDNNRTPPGGLRAPRYPLTAAAGLAWLCVEARERAVEAPSSSGAKAAAAEEGEEDLDLGLQNKTARGAKPATGMG